MNPGRVEGEKAMATEWWRGSDQLEAYAAFALGAGEHEMVVIVAKDASVVLSRAHMDGIAAAWHARREPAPEAPTRGFKVGDHVEVRVGPYQGTRGFITDGSVPGLDVWWVHVGGIPCPLLAEEIVLVSEETPPARSELAAPSTPVASTELKPGDLVQIRNGAWRGYEGVVVEPSRARAGEWLVRIGVFPGHPCVFFREQLLPIRDSDMSSPALEAHSS